MCFEHSKKDVKKFLFKSGIGSNTTYNSKHRNKRPILLLFFIHTFFNNLLTCNLSFSVSHCLQSTGQNRNSVCLAGGRGDTVDGLFWLLLFSHGKLASESKLGTRHHTRVGTGHRILDIGAGRGKEMTADVNLYLSSRLTLKTMNKHESTKFCCFASTFIPLFAKV